MEDINGALSRAVVAGAVSELPVSERRWGRLAVLADPFGHGYDALVEDRPHRWVPAVGRHCIPPHSRNMSTNARNAEAICRCFG